MSKVVDFDKFFHLTLIGISVTDFQSVSSESKGLKAFFSSAAQSHGSKEITMESEISGKKQEICENVEETSKNMMKSNNKRALKELNDEDFFDTKRQKIPNDTELKNLGWDPQVFQNLPNELQKELLNSKKVKIEKSDNIIPEDHDHQDGNSANVNELKNLGWDPVVFQNLPSQLRTELLSNQNQQSKHNLKSTKTSKNNSILNYFSKK